MTENSIKWFRSFLTNRSQRVRIEEVLSSLENLTSGVPQGGILSPVLVLKTNLRVGTSIPHSFPVPLQFSDWENCDMYNYISNSSDWENCLTDAARTK